MVLIDNKKGIWYDPTKQDNKRSQNLQNIW